MGGWIRVDGRGGYGLMGGWVRVDGRVGKG